MYFKCFVPYTQLEINIIESTGGEIEEFYFSVEELKELCGEVEYTEMNIEIEYIDGLDETIFPVDELKVN
jgi:hypothetical protein